MKKLKSIISVICIISMLFGYAVTSAAVPAEECSYSAKFDNRDYAPPVESASIDDSCLYYSILSTAGSYAKKYFNASDTEADFNEKSLVEIAGNPDIHNFGDVLYKSIGCNIGSGYAITSVEFLTGRGERYLKEKIKENGAIVAAFAVPDEKGLTDSQFYNSDENSFVYTGGENDEYHAVSIVGWDDNYDVEKYNQDQNGRYISIDNGAWICKNSCGTDFGDGGYFYMSYTTPIIYAAALEVSQVSGVSLIFKPNQLLKHVGFIYGVNIRAFSASTEEITVKVGNKTAFSDKVELKNGCNLILFDKPVLCGRVSITGENISTANDTFFCYWTLLPMKNKMTVNSAVKDESWTEDVENIWISVENNSAYCLTKNPATNHIVRKNSNDNCCYIIPADGYRFTENTVIKKIDGFDDSNLKKLYPNDYKAFKKSSTIKEAVEADYKRLKNGDGTFKTMIEFDPTFDGGRGMLKIVSQNIGSAYVNELNILTDENGTIKNTVLTFDDGSVLTLPAEITLFKDEAFSEKTDNINGLEEYFAEINVSGYYSENLTVKINGVTTECEINTDGAEITVNVRISIPDVTQTIGETFRSIKLILAKLIEKIRFKRR